MRKKLESWFVWPEELIRLLSFSDRIELQRTRAIVVRAYKCLLIVILVNIAIYPFLARLILGADLRAGRWEVFVAMVLVILGLLLISSVCSNWLYYSFCALTWDQFGEVKGDYSRYVSKKIEGYFNELFANMFTYGFKVTSVLTGIIKLILFSVMIVVSEEKLSIKLGLFGLVGISLLGIILFGWKFYKSSWKLRERLVAHRQPVSRDLAVRVVTPALYNVYLAGVLPISLVLLTHFGLASTITLIALLFSLLGMFWDFVQNAEGAMVTKKMVKGINKYLGKLTNKYVLTDEGYRRMASLTQPKKAILKRSKENKSLVLDNLILKYITNGGNTRRKFSIEIKPGLYQLCGENGIGKTTLLETLTLTNEELVELASGGAAFAGEPLFDFESDLSKHRARYTYIGKYTKQRAVDGALMKKLTNYPIISNFLKKLMLSKKRKYSEGEKAISAICIDLFKRRRPSILVVDELLSKIHNDHSMPIRDEVITMLTDFANSNGYIVIIVDHVVEIAEAVRLRMHSDKLVYA